MKKIIILICFFLFSCGEEIIYSTSFQRTYKGSYTIKKDDQKLIETAFPSLDPASEIEDTFIFNATEGSLDIESEGESGFFDMICRDKSGKTVVSGSLTNDIFLVESQVENINGIKCKYSGYGTLDGEKVSADFKVELMGGDYDGNVIEIDFEGEVSN